MLLWLLAALVVVAALAWLSVALVRTWKLVMRVARGVGEAGERMANASAALEAAQRAHADR